MAKKVVPRWLGVLAVNLLVFVGAWDLAIVYSVGLAPEIGSARRSDRMRMESKMKYLWRDLREGQRISGDGDPVADIKVGPRILRVTVLTSNCTDEILHVAALAPESQGDVATGPGLIVGVCLWWDHRVSRVIVSESGLPLIATYDSKELSWNSRHREKFRSEVVRMVARDVHSSRPQAHP